MHPVRLIFLVVVCLGIGAVAGWRLKPGDLPPLTPPSNRSPSNEVPAVAPDLSLTPRAAAAKIPEPPSSPGSFQSGNPSFTERLAMLRWLKANGIFFTTPIFKGDHEISPEMALFYGLTPQETEQLVRASQQTKKRLDELYQKHVQLEATSDSEMLIATVPPFPDEGGKVYNDLLASFSSVLGQERYAVFNDISGDQLENAFENFGTARTRYEVTLQPTEADGKSYYNIARSFVFDVVDYRGGSGGTTSGGSYGRLDLAGLKKSFPALQSFTLPSALRQKSR